MESIIANLVSRFEKGVLSRRELIQGLAMLTATGSAASASPAQPVQESAFKSVKIDHVSIQVTDMAKSMAFYRNIFGLTVVGEDKPNEIVRMGTTKALVSLHHKAPTGIVDHFAIGIEKFNKEAVTAELAKRGLKGEDNLDAGFHVVDPEGISVQIMNG
jgi:catechol 2,3-dioxygenase-like lactoylglutathione lyase family enzyme